MRALWIEDHQLIGDSLEMLLQVVMPEVSLDKARDAEMAVRLVQSIQYEIVLLDWWLGRDDGEAAIKALRAVGCESPVLVVSGDEREPVMRRALAAGAIGYVTKAADPAELVRAMRAALAGVVSRPAGRLFAPCVAPLPGVPHDGPLPLLDVQLVFPSLTPRQCDVFRLLMRGASDKLIARELGLSETTVKTHVRAILAEVGARNRGEAAYAARSRGVGER
jgi:DNA-binding NarL/FixJ family response regulator